MDEPKRWEDFSRSQQAVIVVVGVVEVVMTVIAVRDLVRRPRAQVRGPKVLWALGCAVQPVGPVAYLALGRRSGPERHPA